MFNIATVLDIIVFLLSIQVYLFGSICIKNEFIWNKVLKVNMSKRLCCCVIKYDREFFKRLYYMFDLIKECYYNF